MNDRELLEAAAKAAGHRLVWGDVYQIGADEVDCSDLPYVTDESPDAAPWYWNPLTDDGDALRLAVKLRIDFSDSTLWLEHNDQSHYDPYAATRRVIVRAAAAIGAEQGDGDE